MADDLHPLVAACLAGDPCAVAALVDRFRGQVFGLCLRMLGHRQDAEDVTQESFVRAIRSLANWDSSREFRPWLLAIAANRCRTLLASRARRPVPVADLEYLPDKSAEAGSARHLVEEVNRALATLRQEYREAFLLFHQQQLSYAEIGEVLGCPLGTVKTWVHRARRDLAAQLRQRGIVEERSHAL